MTTTLTTTGTTRTDRSMARFAVRCVGLLTAGLAAMTLSAGPASAADVAAGHFIVDTDTVAMNKAGAGSLSGMATAFHADGQIQLQVHGTVTRTTNGTAPCVFARAYFYYADGATTSLDSPRACVGENAQRTVDLHSKASGDVVKYAVQLRTAVDSTSQGVVVDGSTFPVGDAPDSLGAAAQLDKDVLRITSGSATVFNGGSVYSVEQRIVSVFPPKAAGVQRSRVTGTLTWSDSLPGTQAYALITWKYADGTSNTAKSNPVSRGGAPVVVDKTSSDTKDVYSVKVDIITSPPVALGTGWTKLGDYLSA
jgi:hypothetical protein